MVVDAYNGGTLRLVGGNAKRLPHFIITKPDYQFTSINIDSKWGEVHRQAVAAVLRAIRKGQDYMGTHPKEAAEVAAQELKTNVGLSERALQDLAKLHILSRDLSVSERGIETVFATVKSVGLIRPDAKFDAHRIVDTSYLKLSMKPSRRN